MNQLDPGLQVQRETSLTLGRMVMPLLVITVFAIVQSLRYGFRASDYRILIVGSILTTLLAFAYALVSVMRANGSPKKPGWRSLRSAGSFPMSSFCIFSFTGGYGPCLAF